MGTRRVYRFDEAEWHVPVAPGTDPEAAADAGRKGVTRRLFAQGDGGFFTQVVRIPPDFAAPAHSHDHAEVFIVLEGSCHFDGEPMARFDMTVVEANDEYAFTAGPEGLSFLVVRRGAAAFSATDS